MNEKSLIKELSQLKSKAFSEYDTENHPSKKESFLGFINNIGRSACFVLSEKENILFAFMQLITIAFMYFVWIQVLDWIPQDVWDSLKESDGSNTPILNLLVLAWSFICVGIAAYPLGILTGCHGASYLLRAQGRESTIVECFKIVFNHSWGLWVFSWVDGWWTMLRILERLPKKRDHTPLSVKLRNEAIYQAWKAASLGFVPALLSGRGVQQACKDSLALLRTRFLPLIKLRIGYSITCWALSILGYIGTIVVMPFLIIWFAQTHNEIYNFYFLIGFPIIAILIIVMLILRPLYLIAACRIYVDYTVEHKIEISLPQASLGFISSLVAFAVLVLALGGIILFRNDIGLTQALSYLH